MTTELKQSIAVQAEKVEQTLTLPAHILRSAMQVQAKNDVRFYLKGFYLKTNGEIVATNGHTIYRAKLDGNGVFPIKYDSLDSDGAIIRIDGTIPKRSTEIVFDFEGMVCRCYKTGKAFSFEYIEGKYPDYQRVIDANSKIESVESIGFNSDYLSVIAKVFPPIKGMRPVKVDFHGQLGAASVSLLDDTADQLLLIMPCRL